MKTALLLSIAAIFSGCMYRVDVTKQHSGVVGEWRLKVDTYVIQYDDDLFAYYAIPCDLPSQNSLPDWDTTYSESRFGSKGNGVEIVGGLPEGSIVAITSVIEDHHATMGISYEPFSKIKDMNGKLRRTNFKRFYRESSESQTLNPDWAERISEN